MRAFLFFLFYATITAKAQFMAPYRFLGTDDRGQPDSIWVLFPDIQAAKKTILLPFKAVDSPRKLHVKDTILLDSAYHLTLVITKIKWIDSLKCKVFAKLPERQNVELEMYYWWFVGGNWILEGKTGDDPVACDQLTMVLWDPKTIALGVAFRHNCDK